MAEPGDVARQVTLTRDGDGYLVTVLPPHDQHPPRRFTDYREARGMAGGTRMVTGWKLIDECDQAGARPAGKGR